jgi:hypothetical protein
MKASAAEDGQSIQVVRDKRAPRRRVRVDSGGKAGFIESSSRISFLLSDFESTKTQSGSLNFNVIIINYSQHCFVI